MNYYDIQIINDRKYKVRNGIRFAVYVECNGTRAGYWKSLFTTLQRNLGIVSNLLK